MKRTLYTVSAGLAGALMLSGAAVAEYPERDISYIIPSSAGGGTDTTARTLIPFLEKALGGTIVAINKPGGGGAIGIGALIKAKPDGYTLGQPQVPALVAKQFENKKVKFGSGSVEYIGRIAYDAMVIGVAPGSPIKNLKDLIAHAKSKPGDFTCATPGIGGTAHLYTHLFMKANAIDLTMVPFKGGGKSRAAFLGGHTTGACMNSAGLVKAKKKVRLLAQAADTRLASMSSVPTFKEQGYDIVGGTQRIIAAPKGTPAAIVKKLRDAMAQVMKDPAYLAVAKKSKVPVDYVDGETLARNMIAEEKKFGEIWKNSPWKKVKKK